MRSRRAASRAHAIADEVGVRLGAWAAALCVALILCAGWLPWNAQRPPRGAGTSTPVIPALQSLINSATATPAAASGGVRRLRRRCGFGAVARQPGGTGALARQRDRHARQRPAAHRARRPAQETARRLAKRRAARARAAEPGLARRDRVRDRVVRIRCASGPHAGALLGRTLQCGRQRALHDRFTARGTRVSAAFCCRCSACCSAGARAPAR